jgi:BarA-like signal transduction histidine kinase
MYRPPLRGRPALADKKVLLIDRCHATREARGAVLRSSGVEVHEAEEIPAARFLWQPDVYDLVMLDVRRYSPAGAWWTFRHNRMVNARAVSCSLRPSPFER